MPFVKSLPARCPLVKGPLSAKAHLLRRSWMGRTEQIWSSYGIPFLYTAANWSGATWYLEAYFRSTSAKALCQLYDNTAGAAVANSLLTADGATPTPSRYRSGVLTLVDGHEYRIQFGNQDQGAGAFLGAQLIAV